MRMYKVICDVVQGESPSERLEFKTSAGEALELQRLRPRVENFLKVQGYKRPYEILALAVYDGSRKKANYGGWVVE